MKEEKCEHLTESFFVWINDRGNVEKLSCRDCGKDLLKDTLAQAEKRGEEKGRIFDEVRKPIKYEGVYYWLQVGTKRAWYTDDDGNVLEINLDGIYVDSIYEGKDVYEAMEKLKKNFLDDEEVSQRLKDMGGE